MLYSQNFRAVRAPLRAPEICPSKPIVAPTIPSQWHKPCQIASQAGEFLSTRFYKYPRCRVLCPGDTQHETRPYERSAVPADTYPCLLFLYFAWKEPATSSTRTFRPSYHRKYPTSTRSCMEGVPSMERALWCTNSYCRSSLRSLIDGLSDSF